MVETRITYLLFGLVIFISCSHSNTIESAKEAEIVELKRGDYLEYFEKNVDFVQIKEIGEVEFKCHHIPLELLIDSKRKSMTENQIELLRTKSDSILFFQLSISPTKESNQSIFGLVSSGISEEDFFNYLNFNYDKDIYLVENNDTIACSTYIFERSYNLTRDLKFLIGFSGKGFRNSNLKTIVLSDPFFDCGIIKFAYEGELFSNNFQIISQK